MRFPRPTPPGCVARSRPIRYAIRYPNHKTPSSYNEEAMRHARMLLAAVVGLAEPAVGDDAWGHRRGFIEMARRAEQLARQSAG